MADTVPSTSDDGFGNGEADRIIDIRTQRLFNMFNTLSRHALDIIQTRIQSIRNELKGSPGAGLSSGTLSDLFLVKYLKTILPLFEGCHEGEADGKCDEILFSIKTICDLNGSDLALDWSKNPTDIGRDKFTCPICIVVIYTSTWWKKLEGFNDKISSGLYFIDPLYCRENITLTSNNKTNSLISRKQVYRMLQYAKSTGTFIPFADSVSSCRFDILSAFN